MQLKRLNVNKFCSIFLVTALLYIPSIQAQPLKIIHTYGLYQKTIQKDSLKKMVEIKTLLPAILYDLRYATRENFMRKKLYKKQIFVFFRSTVAKALLNVFLELQSQGFVLKIWDGYRPYSVTKKMWKLVQDERYVANPAKGSGHNRGLAMDITLVDARTRLEIDMGTGFDNFTDSAHHSFNNLPTQVLQHRQLLKATMEKYGFKALETEWWHYSYPNDRDYEVLDLPFKKLL